MTIIPKNIKRYKIKSDNKLTHKFIDHKFLERDVLYLEFDEKTDYNTIINTIANSCINVIPIKYLKPNKMSYTIQKSVPYINHINFDENKSIDSKLLEYSLTQHYTSDLIIAGITNIFDTISYIPINQELPINSIFKIELYNDYIHSTKRYFIRSKSIKNISKIDMIPFDENIHLGSIDIGGYILGEFSVDETINRKAYSFTRPTENSVEIITLSSMNLLPDKIIKLLNLDIKL